jgi:hypothetical protein
MPLLLCPNDNASMTSVNRHGVEFDMCPVCRGVWLDRGELEKLMGASEGSARPAEPPRPAPSHEPRRYDDDRRPFAKRRKGFDLFDIFD